MMARPAAIAVLAIVCVVDAGCRAPRPPLMPPSPITLTTIADPIAEPLVPSVRPRKSFTITFVAFIPANHLVAPWIHPQAYGSLVPPMRLAFAGDDRGFDIDAASYRAKQVVTVIPDEADDADGLVEGSKRNLGGISESFDARLALADGRIDEADRRRSPGGRPIKHAELAVNIEGMIIEDPIRLGPHRVFVRLRTAAMRGPRNPLIVGSPSIDWDIGVTIDISGPEPRYDVAGTWDGYPAAELYINRQPVFTVTAGAGPGSSRDLLKLLPAYGDLRFVTTGTLTDHSAAVVPN
jgi:hypothetical protein